MRGLEGKVAIVTGGASGLGLAIAERLAEEGVKVVISDINEALGQRVARDRGFAFYAQDVVDEGRWESLISAVEYEVGPLEILINNAGIAGATGFNPETATLSDWRRTVAINLDGVFLGCRAAIKAMRRTGHGGIVNISSMAAMRATPHMTAYGAAKAGVRQLTQSVAQYCAQQRLNIRCNSVHPGYVRTSLWDSAGEAMAARRGVNLDSIVAEAETIIPLGDMTRPSDIAAGVAFLASDDARHMTGEQLIIDGGIVSCNTFTADRLTQLTRETS